jgi:hypothetical protein
VVRDGSNWQELGGGSGIGTGIVGGRHLHDGPFAVMHRTNNRWRFMVGGRPQRLNGVHGIGEHVIAVGDEGLIAIRRRGVETDASGTTDARTTWGRAPSESWAVGDNAPFFATGRGTADERRDQSAACWGAFRDQHLRGRQRRAVLNDGVAWNSRRSTRWHSAAYGVTRRAVAEPALPGSPLIQPPAVVGLGEHRHRVGAESVLAFLRDIFVVGLGGRHQNNFYDAFFNYGDDGWLRSVASNFGTYTDVWAPSGSTVYVSSASVLVYRGTKN